MQPNIQRCLDWSPPLRPLPGRHAASICSTLRNCLAWLHCHFHCLASQVVLLDPVQYPGAMKAFAREICRNDLLNFGRLHFFFPDSRMSLDLNTDKTLKVTHILSQDPAKLPAVHTCSVQILCPLLLLHLPCICSSPCIRHFA